MTAADIFGHSAEVFTPFHARVQLRELLIGGIPSSPSVIRAWLRAKLDMEDQALTELVAQIAADRETDDPLTTDETLDAIMADPEARPSINGFLRNGDANLLFPGRCVKACLKEAANSAFPGKTWPGKTSLGVQKGCSASFVERVFVEEDTIPILVEGQPVSGFSPSVNTEERVKHVRTPQGKKSVISRVETVLKPSLEFTVLVRDPEAFEKVWPRVWASAEEIGMGADRARSDGRFNLEIWEEIKKGKK
jgi:hypothetical protein